MKYNLVEIRIEYSHEDETKKQTFTCPEKAMDALEDINKHDNVELIDIDVCLCYLSNAVITSASIDPPDEYELETNGRTFLDNY